MNRDPLELMARLVNQDPPVKRVSAALLAHQDQRVNVEERAHLDHLDQLVVQERMDQKVFQGLEVKTEEMENEEIKVRLALMEQEGFLEQLV